MSAPWTADQILDEARVRAILHRRFPALGLGPEGRAQLERIGEGWDNAAWTVALDDNPSNLLVFRLPRRALGGALIVTEAAALPAIAPTLPVPITAPTHAAPALTGAEAIEDYPYPVAGYPHLAGTPLDAARLAPPDRLRLAAELGAALRALHDFDPARAEALGVPGDHLNRADLTWQAEKARGRLPELTVAGHAAEAERLAAAIDQAEADVAANPEPAGAARTLHGDLYARHLLVDPTTKGLAGLIDWGDLHRGDVAVDLAVAEAVFDPAGRAAFAAAYGPISAGTRARARLLGLRSLSALLLYAQAIDDGVMWAEAVQGLELWWQNDNRN